MNMNRGFQQQQQPDVLDLESLAQMKALAEIQSRTLSMQLAVQSQAGRGADGSFDLAATLQAAAAYHNFITGTTKAAG